jgi:hypothetical protein
MPERTLGRLCRRWRIAVTTPKVAAAAAQRPKQLLFLVVIGGDDMPICEDDLCGEQIIERKSKAADQSSVTAAQGESRHADGADRPRHRRDTQRICCR